MVESQIIENSVNKTKSSVDDIKNSVDLANFVKAIKKEELLEFAKEYLKKNTFVSAKKLSTGYLYERHNLTYRSGTYVWLRKALLHRFRRTIMLLTQEKLIVGYNSTVYKRVDLQESNNFNSDKISNQILQKTVISSSKIDNETNEVKLIYHQGRFLNPNFYDLEHQYKECLGKL